MEALLPALSGFALALAGAAAAGATLLAVMFKAHAKLIENLMAQNTGQQRQLNMLQSQHTECLRLHADCQAHDAEQEKRIKKLEQLVHGGPPKESSDSP